MLLFDVVLEHLLCLIVDCDRQQHLQHLFWGLVVFLLDSIRCSLFSCDRDDGTTNIPLYCYWMLLVVFCFGNPSSCVPHQFQAAIDAAITQAEHATTEKFKAFTTTMIARMTALEASLNTIVEKVVASTYKSLHTSDTFVTKQDHIRL
jgi:membrane protein required for beta-lactamase induction